MSRLIYLLLDFNNKAADTPASESFLEIDIMMKHISFDTSQDFITLSQLIVADVNTIVFQENICP